MREKHLYRNGAKRVQERKFEERYGKERGKEIYGAVVGKVKREREEKRKERSHDPPKRRRHDNVFDESFWLG